MACEYTCDGCGKKGNAVFASTIGWTKPYWWYARSADVRAALPDGQTATVKIQIDACSRECQEAAERKFGCQSETSNTDGRPRWSCSRTDPVNRRANESYACDGCRTDSGASRCTSCGQNFCRDCWDADPGHWALCPKNPKNAAKGRP